MTDDDVVAKLKELHKSFVVVPTDKAANNVSIICKKYYHQCMQAELMSNVYEPVSTSEDDIIDKHVKELGSHNITIPDDNKKLPFIYSTAKQHKTPVGNRFIVSGKRCTTKKLSKVLLKVFQLVSKTLKYHCQYKCRFLKTKSYWIIQKIFIGILSNSTTKRKLLQFIHMISRSFIPIFPMVCLETIFYMC